MCDYLHEHGHCCGQCSQKQGCESCGADCEHDYHVCDCGSTVCPDCTAVCDICGERFCRQCWSAAKEEVNGGLNAQDTGLDICYSCTENGEVQKALEEFEFSSTAAPEIRDRVNKQEFDNFLKGN